MEEGLEVGGKSCPLRHDRCWGVLRSAPLMVVSDWCCLTAHHRTDLEKLVLRYGLEVARRDFCEDHIEHVDGIVRKRDCKR